MDKTNIVDINKYLEGNLAKDPKSLFETRIKPETATVDRADFATYFKKLAEEGHIERITLHLPQGTAYGIGGIESEMSGVSVMEGKVDKFYTATLMFLALVLGAVITLGIVNYLSVFETIVSSIVVIIIGIATGAEWKGWYDGE